MCNDKERAKKNVNRSEKPDLASSEERAFLAKAHYFKASPSEVSGGGHSTLPPILQSSL